jgi:hypothetical protein
MIIWTLNIFFLTAKHAKEAPSPQNISHIFLLFAPFA